MMRVVRFIHTSDWHLGLDLAGHDRLDEQGRFLEWLRQQCRAAKVDALLVAGDIYDIVSPSAPAQRWLADFLVGMHRDCPHTTVVLTGGNHDSALRLETARPFGQALGRLAIVGGLDQRAPDLAEKALVPLRDVRGDLLAVCLAVPFLRVSDLDCRLGPDESPAVAYERSLGALYATLRAQAERLAPEKPLIGMGHLTLGGGQKAGSEHLLVGGIDGIGVEGIAEGLDYLALGHLHRGQRVGGERIHYSGSPFAIDFDERRYRHRILLVELAARGATPAVSEIEVPVFVPLLRIPEQPGSWDDLARAFAAVAWADYADRPRALYPFVELELLDDGTLPDLRARVEKLCSGRPLRLVGSPRRFPPEAPAPMVGESRAAAEPTWRLGDRAAPLEVFALAWQRRHGAPPPDPVRAAFEEVMTAVMTEGESA
ncbi:MAG: exonuclease SbcCD subunit D C-terminal domain-containing protein [Polyangiaceae bacterium]|nr:exonuclease SbcCD subunit D C-terminal domain-containing protein [Polyangiaceae bacterium]